MVSLPFNVAQDEFASVYEGEVGLLRQIARYRFSVPVGAVDDVVQDVFLSYFLARDSVRDVRPWLVGAVCNASRRYWMTNDALDIPHCSINLVDSGIRRGADVVKALCLGARAVLIGRAYAYGLGAAGGAGVARAIDILRVDILRTMKLLGCPSLGELDRSFVDVPLEWLERR